MSKLDALRFLKMSVHIGRRHFNPTAPDAVVLETVLMANVEKLFSGKAFTKATCIYVHISLGAEVGQEPGFQG